MPLVETPGDPTANTYATVAEADAYNAARPSGGTGWAALTPEQKEGALAYTTSLLDSAFVWTGTPSLGANPSQALCWPRMGMLTRNGVPIDPMVIPKELKDAHCEYARQAANADIAADDDAAKAGLSSVKAGSVSVGFQSRKAAEGVALSTQAYSYLGNAVPYAVRLLLVPSWYQQQAILAAATQRGIYVKADR